MPTDDIVLGVELEFAIVGDPDALVEYTSPYPVMKSYPKPFTPSTNTHVGHGNLVRAVEEATSGFVRVGYDATVATEPDGWELFSQPGPFMDQLQAWSAFWDSPVTQYMSVGVDGKTPGGQPKMCGMHVHVSGKLMTPITMANMLIFINNRSNAPLILYVADRYDGYYSKIQDKMTFDNALFLYHAADCTKWRKKKILEAHYPDMYQHEWGGGTTWCCQNAKEFHTLKISDYFVRGALWATPKDGTGDCEFRLFSTPTCRDRFFANLEFVHSLVQYCHSTGPRDSGHEKYCEWLMEVPLRRIRYKHLFKWLREAGYVEGLIPRKRKNVKAAVG